MERFSRTLEGGGERSWDSSGVAEKTPVEVDHTEESLKSRFIRGWRGWRLELVRQWPRNSVSETANSHLPRPKIFIVRQWTQHSSRT